MKTRSNWSVPAAGLLLYWGGATVQADSQAANGQLVSGVRVHNDSISIDVRGLGLGALLDEIERQAAVSFVVPESIRGETVSNRFENLPLVEGIRLLLEGRSYLIDHAPPQSNGHSLSLTIRLLESSGSSRKSGASTGAANNDLDEQAAQRAEKLIDLADEADLDRVMPALREAVSDPHSVVREAALEIIDAMDDEEAPAQLVAEIALRDASPELRMEALEVMTSLAKVQGDLVQDTLRKALNDSSSEVREMASDLIEAD